MLIDDRLYGEADVEPVLSDLIRSEAVQRLKGVHQGGASFLVHPGWNITRFEHSLGVMLLIRQLGGSHEEQIAGLLHDVSHTAFSHVVDDVFNIENEDYHEQIFATWVSHSAIPEILHTYGFNHEELLDDDRKWTLLERPAPALCVDRIDYTLRDSFAYGFANKDEIATFLQTGLTVFAGEICCTSIEAAEWFTDLYYKEVIGFFMNPLNLYGLDTVSSVLKQALEMELISVQDVLKTDDELLAVLKQDSRLHSQLDRLTTAKQHVKQGNPDDFTFHKTLKTRNIDPSVIHQGDKTPASALSENVRRMKERAADKMKKGAFVKVTE